jgi:hypothetical protein
MLGRPFQAGEFDLKEMLDDVLDERLRSAKFAPSQILDLLSDLFRVNAVPGQRQMPQQIGLLLRPGVEIFFIERIGRHFHAFSVTEHAGRRDSTVAYVYHSSAFVRKLAVGIGRGRRTVGHASRRCDLAADLGHEISSQSALRRAA